MKGIKTHDWLELRNHVSAEINLEVCETALRMCCSEGTDAVHNERIILDWSLEPLHAVT